MKENKRNQKNSKGTKETEISWGGKKWARDQTKQGGKGDEWSARYTWEQRSGEQEKGEIGERICCRGRETSEFQNDIYVKSNVALSCYSAALQDLSKLARSVPPIWLLYICTLSLNPSGRRTWDKISRTVIWEMISGSRSEKQEEWNGREEKWTWVSYWGRHCGRQLGLHPAGPFRRPVKRISTLSRRNI